jgi:TonB family protein
MSSGSRTDRGGRARRERPPEKRAPEAPGGVRLSHIVVISFELHVAAVMLILGSGLLEARLPPKERRVDIVSIKDLLPTVASTPQLAAQKPQAAVPPEPKSGPEPPPASTDPTVLNEKLDEADGSFTGMSVAASGVSSSAGRPRQGGAGGGSGDDFSDFVPQYAISELPVISENDVRSRITYPVLAAKQGIEATVYLELFIDGSGRIVHINVLKDPGFGFADAAVKALLNLVCSPAKMDGKPAAVRYRYPVSFKLR